MRKARDLSKSKEEKLPIETKADYKAWKKARKELEMGESISHEELKGSMGYELCNQICQAGGKIFR